MPRVYLDVSQLPTGIIKRLAPGVLPGLIQPGGNAPMVPAPDPVPPVKAARSGSGVVMRASRRRRRGRRR